MEGSSEFQDLMESQYQYLYQEPMVPTPQFQVEPSSNIPMGPPPNEQMKWTDEMARLLITAISYITDSALSEPDNDDSTTRKFMFMPKTTKWKVISNVMIERGYNLSPQQCEEKFTEIDKKYKQMISLLGKSTSCKVVENPTLLESVKIPEIQKEEIRRLMGSDQFLYREICSLQNGNRLFLPHDWELRRLVFTNLACNYDDGNKKVLRARWIKLEEKKLEIQQQRLQLEKTRLDWLRLNQNEEIKLEKMRLENETLKLKNARLAFQLKCKETAGFDDIC